MDKKFDSHNLAKLFGVENIVTPKTLVTETDREVRRKLPNDAANDIRALLDEINVRIMSQDIVGVCKCLDAIKLRVAYLDDIANQMRKAQGK